jgi:hypothetical protein
MELAVGVIQQQWQAEQWLTHTQSHTRCALKQPIPFPVVCNCWLVVFYYYGIYFTQVLVAGGLIL